MSAKRCRQSSRLLQLPPSYPDPEPPARKHLLGWYGAPSDPHDPEEIRIRKHLAGLPNEKRQPTRLTKPLPSLDAYSASHGLGVKPCGSAGKTLCTVVATIARFMSDSLRASVPVATHRSSGYTRILPPPTRASAAACQEAVQRHLVLETPGRKRTAIHGFPPRCSPNAA